jgi:hypothetical protein
MNGYQDKGPGTTLPIVNCAVKVNPQGYEQPIILILNYVSLLEDESEFESLLQPYQCMKH